MGPWARRSLSLSFSVFCVSLSRSAAAPWTSNSAVGGTGGSALEAILHNAGREVPQLPSLPTPASTGVDLFAIGKWLAGPLSLAGQQLSTYSVDGLRSPLAGTAEFSRRLRPQFPAELPRLDRPQQWLTAVPVGAPARAVGSTVQQQRQQPQQEREMAAAATKLASGLSSLRVPPTPKEQQALDTIAVSLQALRTASNRGTMKDTDRAIINKLTAAVAKSVEDMEVMNPNPKP